MWRIIRHWVAQWCISIVGSTEIKGLESHFSRRNASPGIYSIGVSPHRHISECDRNSAEFPLNGEGTVVLLYKFPKFDFSNHEVRNDVLHSCTGPPNTSFKETYIRNYKVQYIPLYTSCSDLLDTSTVDRFKYCAVWDIAWSTHTRTKPKRYSHMTSNSTIDVFFFFSSKKRQRCDGESDAFCFVQWPLVRTNDGKFSHMRLSYCTHCSSLHHLKWNLCRAFCHMNPKKTTTAKWITTLQDIFYYRVRLFKHSKECYTRVASTFDTYTYVHTAHTHTHSRNHVASRCRMCSVVHIYFSQLVGCSAFLRHGIETPVRSNRETSKTALHCWLSGEWMDVQKDPLIRWTVTEFPEKYFFARV